MDVKKITMYIKNALALNKFLRISEYPKDHLSTEFNKSGGPAGHQLRI